MYGDGDFFDMKGVCEEFFEKAGMKKKVHYTPDSGKPYLHPGRQARILYEGKAVGYLGEVHPLVADAYGIGEKAYIAVIDILDILEFAGFDHKYTGIAKYPAVTRDLSMVVPKMFLQAILRICWNREAERSWNPISSLTYTRERRSKRDINPWRTLLYSATMTEHWRKRILPR